MAVIRMSMIPKISRPKNLSNPKNLAGDRMKRAILVLVAIVMLTFAGCCCPTQEGCFFTGHSMCPKHWIGCDYPYGSGWAPWKDSGVCQ